MRWAALIEHFVSLLVGSSGQVRMLAASLGPGRKGPEARAGPKARAASDHVYIYLLPDLSRVDAIGAPGKTNQVIYVGRQPRAWCRLAASCTSWPQGQLLQPGNLFQVFGFYSGWVLVSLWPRLWVPQRTLIPSLRDPHSKSRGCKSESRVVTSNRSLRDCV